jgi:hypothetical protein
MPFVLIKLATPGEEQSSSESWAERRWANPLFLTGNRRNRLPGLCMMPLGLLILRPTMIAAKFSRTIRHISAPQVPTFCLVKGLIGYFFCMTAYGLRGPASGRRHMLRLRSIPLWATATRLCLPRLSLIGRGSTSRNRRCALLCAYQRVISARNRPISHPLVVPRHHRCLPLEATHPPVAPVASVPYAHLSLQHVQGLVYTS